MAFIESLKELKDVDFADLDIQQIGAWPAALKAILLLTVLLVILALGYFFKVQDVSQQTQIAARQEAELLREYENKAFLAANLDAYRAQMVELDETFGALLQQLPKDTEVPGLL